MTLLPPSPSPSNSYSNSNSSIDNSEPLSPAPSFVSSTLFAHQANREDSLSSTTSSVFTLPSEMDSNFNHFGNHPQEKSHYHQQSYNQEIESNGGEVDADVGSSSLDLDVMGADALNTNNKPRRTQRIRQPPQRKSTTTLSSRIEPSSASGPSSSSFSNSNPTQNGKQSSAISSGKSNTASSSSTRSTPRTITKKPEPNSASTSSSKSNDEVPIGEDPRGPTRRGQPRKLFRYLQDYEALGLGSAQAAKEAAEQQSREIAAQQQAHNDAAKGKGKKRAFEEPALGPDGKPKRRNTAKACLFCKRSHMTCDDIRPCQRCVKRGIGHLCTDEIPGSAGAPAGSSHSHSSPSKVKGKASSKASKTKSRRASETAVAVAAKASAAQKTSLKLPRAIKSRASNPGFSSTTPADDDDDKTSAKFPKKTLGRPQPAKQDFPAYVAAPSKPSLSAVNDSDSESESEDEEDSRPLLNAEADQSIATGVPIRAEPHESVLFHGDGSERGSSFSSLRKNTIQAEEFNMRTLAVQNHDQQPHPSHHLAPISTANVYPLQPELYGNGKGRQLSPQTATFPLDHSVYQQPPPSSHQHHSSVSPHSYHSHPSIVHRMPTHPQSATIPSVSSFWPDEVPIQNYHQQDQHLHSHQSQSQGHHQRGLHEMSGMGAASEIDSSSTFDDYLRQHEQQQQQQQQHQQNGSQASAALDLSDWPAYGSSAYSHLHTRHMSLPQTGVGLGMGPIPVNAAIQNRAYEMNISDHQQASKFFPERSTYSSMDNHTSQIIDGRGNSFSHQGQIASNDASVGGLNHASTIGNNLDYQRSYHSASPFSPGSRFQEAPMKQSHQQHSHHYAIRPHSQHGYQIFDPSNQHHGHSTTAFDSYHSHASNSNSNSNQSSNNAVNRIPTSQNQNQHQQQQQHMANDPHQHPNHHSSNLDPFAHNAEHAGLNMDHYLSQSEMGMQM